MVMAKGDTTMDDSVSGAAAKMVKSISDATADVKEGAADLSRHADDEIEAIRETIAGTIEETSAVVQSGGKQISEMAELAAEKIQGGAEYVRRADLRTMGANVKNLVKRYPKASILVGAVAGFLIAWSFRSDD
jgi:methyl-accepting chemotaxis protein